MELTASGLIYRLETYNVFFFFTVKPQNDWDKAVKKISIQYVRAVFICIDCL